jgi:hypothetical protein
VSSYRRVAASLWRRVVDRGTDATHGVTPMMYTEVLTYRV